MSDSRADQTRYAAERAMEPILRRWFAIDLEPVNLWSNAENAAVDLSYALEDAGLLLPTQLVIKGAMSADLKCACGFPDGCARLPRECSHAIYHHGCPSCDRQDPEDRE